MKKNNYSIAKPYFGSRGKKEILRNISEALDFGALSLGPKYREFEQRFAEKIGTKYACVVSSGTAGLHLTMIAAGIKTGDEVITSPFSFIASANCILYVGAKPVFVDIDPVTYNIDPEKIEEKITARTKAILIVHIFGQSANMEPIIRIARKHKLRIIEDACESICAKYKRKNVGTFGESAVFSFYPNKQMTTGEGAMIVTDSKKIYDVCCSLRNQGRTEDMQWLDHKYLGYNYRLNEISAIVGISQLKNLDFMLEERRKIAVHYNKYLKPHGELIKIPQIAGENVHSWFVYVARIKNKKINRDEIIERLKKEGISSKPYLPSIHLFDFYKKSFGYKLGDFPISEEVSQYSLALPLYIGLKEKDVKYIVNKLIDILKKYE